jgi:flagellar hook-associated protein 2
MSTSTSSINVSSLTSSTSGSFDWQTYVTQIIAADSTPVTNLQAEVTANKAQISALATLNTDLTQLKTYAQALVTPSLYTARTTSATDANWSASATNGTATGSYTIAVTKLATAASLVGGGKIAAGLSSTSNVDGLTLATLPTATAVTAGNFTVNGQTVKVALTDSLQDVFDKISTATNGSVTASYDPGSDGITLANTNPLDTTEIVLGAINDSSNFLDVMQLSNNGGTSVSSANALGAVTLDVPLDQSNLNTAITAVDSSGNGSFMINGVSIAYNTGTDSLATVMQRINASSAGVTASYDSTTNNVVLTNDSTGDFGLGANDVADTGKTGLLSALGLTGNATLQHGQNAQFSVNNGATLSSRSNTLDGSTFGASGLSVTATTATTQTVTVAADTSSMETAIQNFASQYNTVKSYISTETTSTTNSDGTVTTGTLANDLDVPKWVSNLQSRIFATVPGLSGTVKQLSDLGLDFDSSGEMIIKDSSKLQNALANHSADVAAYFTQASTGMASNVNSYLSGLLLPSTGAIAMLTNSLTSSDTDLDTQISTLQAQLTKEQTTLTTAFEAMQSAQATAQSQLNYLTAVANLQKSGS